MTTACNLARTLGNQGKCAEAQTMYREVLVAERRVLGPEHSSTLAAASNMGYVLNGQGKHGEAEITFREVLVVQRQVLRPEHPHTLMTAANLANALGCQASTQKPRECTTR
jgi:hypothetical protein